MNSPDFQSLKQLKAEWDSLQPLSPENDERLWKKLRLEWDFHSNHIEGNTLTYGETELLVIFGETRGIHTLREYEEMKAHDVAIAHVRMLARESRDLSESDIRELNQLLLKESFWKPAITQDGASTQKQIFPGQYKTQPNNVRLATGEIFRFVDPLDVPLRMQEYLKTLNAKFSEDSDFLLHLARIHHEFLIIHPFDDGNGRVGRLLLNYALLKRGYLPIIIRTEQKSAYLSALHRADTEVRDYSELTRLFEKALRWSFEIGIKAARSEVIEDSTDIEKEIALFANQMPKGIPAEGKSRETLSRLWITSLAPFFKKLSEKTKAFEPLFEEISLKDVITMKSSWISALESATSKPEEDYFSLSVVCERYKLQTERPFSFSFDTSVKINKYDYQLYSDYIAAMPARSFSQLLTSVEIDEIVANILKSVFEVVKRKAEGQA